RQQTRSTLFPYTTVFRSAKEAAEALKKKANAATQKAKDEMQAAADAMADVGKGLAKLIHFERTTDSEGVTTIRIVIQKGDIRIRSEEHTSELQSRGHLVC